MDFIRRGEDERRHEGFLYSNRAFLRCLYGLMRVSKEIGEEAETVRTRNFLLGLDPTDHFEVRDA